MTYTWEIINKHNIDVFTYAEIELMFKDSVNEQSPDDYKTGMEHYDIMREYFFDDLQALAREFFDRYTVISIQGSERMLYYAEKTAIDAIKP